MELGKGGEVKMKRILSLVTVATLVSLGLYVAVAGAQTTDAAFRGGNIFDGGNRTTKVAAWEDPISASPGDIVEFRVTVQNVAPVEMKNVNVKVSLPGSASNPIKPVATATADNAATVSDTATVNVVGGSSQSLTYLAGHAEMCKGTTCSSVADTIHTSGISLGNLAASGGSAQVSFKAQVTSVVAEVAPPLPAPAPAPPPPAGVSQQQEVNVTQQQQVSQNVSVQGAAVPPPPPAPAPQVQAAPRPAALPKAGAEALPALSGLAAAGWYLRRRYLLV